MDLQQPSDLNGARGSSPIQFIKREIIRDSFRWLALAGNPQTGEKVDKDLAAIYLQITKTPEHESEALLVRRLSPLLCLRVTGPLTAARSEFIVLATKWLP